jgi:hypothetical protein
MIYFSGSMDKTPFRIALVLSLAVTLCFWSSCTEGPGGTAGITGLVVTQQFDLYGNLFAEYPSSDERVYLVYGEDSVIGDETRTHYSGRYRFDFLRKGKYTIYAYSDCSTCPGGSDPSMLFIEIDKSGELIDAPTLFIRAQ